MDKQQTWGAALHGEPRRHRRAAWSRRHEFAPLDTDDERHISSNPQTGVVRSENSKRPAGTRRVHQVGHARVCVAELGDAPLARQGAAPNTSQLCC